MHVHLPPLSILNGLTLLMMLTPRSLSLWSFTRARAIPRPRIMTMSPQGVLTVAFAIYYCLIYTHSMYPTHSQELEFVKTGWRISCQQMEVRLEMTPELFKWCVLLQSTHLTPLSHFQITLQGSHVCGELKTKVHPIMESYICGHMNASLSTIINLLRNWSRDMILSIWYAIHLMAAADISFTPGNEWYGGQQEVSLLQQEHPKGCWCHMVHKKARQRCHLPGILQTASWGHPGSSPHCSLPSSLYGNHIVSVIHLQMECGIDEWHASVNMDIPLTTASYCPVFDAHLKCLHAFGEASRTHALLNTRM